jgi:hypothetical protein
VKSSVGVEKLASGKLASMYSFFPAVDNGAPHVCQARMVYNGFHGHGQVNALAAIAH